MFCKMLTIDPVICPNIIPIKSNDTACRTLNDTINTNKRTHTAPNVAEMINPNPESTKDRGKIEPAKIYMATPKLAPELTPNTYGPAKGFWKRVCIINPAIDIADPVNIAVMALGNLKLYMIS